MYVHVDEGFSIFKGIYKSKKSKRSLMDIVNNHVRTGFDFIELKSNLTFNQ